MKHFEIAERFLGLDEKKHTKILNDYFKKHSGWPYSVDTTPWCAAFVNSVLHEAGIKGSGSFMARSLLHIGTPVTTPQKGDIVVFKRGKPPSGHVALFVEDAGPEFIKVLGGNQADKVCIKLYRKNGILGYRRPQ